MLLDQFEDVLDRKCTQKWFTSKFNELQYIEGAGNEIYLYVMPATNLLILFCSE